MKKLKYSETFKVRNLVFLFFIPLLLTALSACSSGEDTIDVSNRNHHSYFDKGPDKFSFKDSGDWYKVKFRDDDIYKLYINGERVEDNEIYKYEDLVYDKREELRESMADLKDEFKDFDFDMDELKESIRSLKEVNMDELSEAMKELKNELKNIDREKFRADIDWDDFHKDLAELKNIKIDIDMDDFHSSMEELSENLSNIRVELDENDWSDFRNEMRNLKDELKDLDVDMSGLKFEMKKLKGFMKDLRSELVDDGYLDYDDDDFDMEFNRDELIINGRKLPHDLFKKYRDMYEEHFGRELDEDFRIRN